MVDYEHKDLFLQDSIEKQVTISYGNTTITNEDLFNQEMTLEESLCSDESITFGACEASALKFKVANIVAPMKGQWMDVSMVLEGNTSGPFQYGQYKVESDQLTADRQWREITAYDAMYDIINADVSEWYESVFPDKDSTMTMREFRRSFVSHFGLEEAEISLVNDGMIVTKTIGITENEDTNTKSTVSSGTALSGKDVMCAICETNGCFGHIGRDGKVHYIYLPQAIQGLYPSNTLYPDDSLYPSEPKSYVAGENGTYISCTYEDYMVKSIDKLQIRQQENDIGCIFGSGDNTYIIEGNFLLYGKSAEELDVIAGNILGKITGISYRPFNAECIGNPCFEVGDPVRLSTTYDIVETYILKRTLKGILALRDTYSSTGTENREVKVNSVSRSIMELKGKTNVLERTAEETKSMITDVEKGLRSEISQTSEKISAEVIRATSAEETLSGRISVTAGEVSTEVSRATAAEGELSSRITVTAEQIASKVSNSDFESYKTQAANEISQKVSSGDVVSEINQSADTIYLGAGKVVITTENFNLDAAGNVSMTGHVVANSGQIGHFNITSEGLQWGSFGTRIRSRVLQTACIRALEDETDGLLIEDNGKDVRIGTWGNKPSRLLCSGDMHIPRDHYIRSGEATAGTSLIGWSSYNNLHIGDYNRSTLPNILALNSKKVQMVNSSGSLVDIQDITSDERQKNILSDIDRERAVEFVESLKPIVYQYKADADQETHWGFGAQTTLAAMTGSGMGESRLIKRNPYIIDAPLNPEDDSTFFYSMEYDELDAPFAAVLQYLLSELKEIKTKIGGL